MDLTRVAVLEWESATKRVVDNVERTRGSGATRLRRGYYNLNLNATTLMSKHDIANLELRRRKKLTIHPTRDATYWQSYESTDCAQSEEFGKKWD